MGARSRRGGKGGSSTHIYFVREGLELCLVLGGLAIADWITNVPRMIWLVLPTGKALFSVLFYAIFLRTSLRGRPRHESASLVGRKVRTLTPLNPDGQISIDGEIWSARSCHGDVIPSEHEVVVREICGRVFLVETPSITTGE